MATTEFHGPVTKDSKTKRHMHMQIYPSTFTWGDAKGNLSAEGTRVLVAVDGQDGHWHIDVSDDLQRILDGLAVKATASQG